MQLNISENKEELVKRQAYYFLDLVRIRETNEETANSRLVCLHVPCSTGN